MKFLDPVTTGLGIDLSDHHLRLAQVGLFGSVHRLEEVVLPEGLVVDEQVEKLDELKTILKERLHTFELTNRSYRTTVLVPESRVFSHSGLISTDVKREERKSRALDAAQREIPVPFSQAQVCVSFGGKEDDQIRVTVYAVARQVFDSLHAAFAESTLRLVAMEANTKALLRLISTFGNEMLQKIAPDSLIAIVDVGHAWTTLSLYTRAGSSVFSRTIPHTRKKKMNVVKTMLPDDTVDTIVETLRETVLFFEQKHLLIGCVVLGGVEAKDERFREKLGNDEKKIPTCLISEVVKLRGISEGQLHAFGSAIGAALRSSKPWQHAYQHNFLE